MIRSLEEHPTSLFLNKPGGGESPLNVGYTVPHFLGAKVELLIR